MRAGQPRQSLSGLAHGMAEVARIPLHLAQLGLALGLGLELGFGLRLG